jgi:hypothetical protein
MMIMKSIRLLECDPQSARGLAHSKTLREIAPRFELAPPLERDSFLPLL